MPDISMLRQRQGSGSLPSHGSSNSNGGGGGLGVGYGGGGYDNGGGYGQQSYGSQPSYGSQNSYGSSGYGSGGGMSTPRRSPSGTKFSMKDKPYNNTSSYLDYLKNPIIIFCIMTIIFLSSTIYYRSSYNSLLQKVGNSNNHKDAHDFITNLQRDKDHHERTSRGHQTSTRNLQNKINDLNKQIDNYKKDINKLQQEKKSIDLELKRSQKNNNGNNNDGSPQNGHEEVTKQQIESQRKHIETLGKREGAWRKQVDVLQKATKKESKREILERFGPGPHRVQFELEAYVPDPKDIDGANGDMITKNYKYTIEMAPLDVMPHAVHLFLQQVYHELWDNTYFYLNGEHVLQAGPQSYEDDEEDAAALQIFKDAELDTLSFPEYSPSYPHTKWTIGFTGRPGGPDFYINKDDNRISHGPGGQRQHTLVEQADPCFAKVIDGFIDLEEIFKLDVYKDDSEYTNFLLDPILILSARIITPLEPVIMHNGNNGNNGNGNIAGTTSFKPDGSTSNNNEQQHEHKHHHNAKPKIDHRLDADEEIYDVPDDDGYHDDGDDHHDDHHDEEHHDDHHDEHHDEHH